MDVIKFNWGVGITLFFSLFVVTLVYTVVRTTYHDHSLVYEKYYEEDLNYQKLFEKMANQKALGEAVKININSTSQLISFEFPKVHKKVVGSVLFFKPDNKRKDKLLPVALENNNVFTISTKTLSPGRWKAKLDWSDGEKGYYQELSLQL